MSKLAWNAASVTDRGLVRKDNQDRCYVSPDQRLFVVADGMGGIKGGGEASRLAVEAVELFWQDKPPELTDPANVQEWLQRAVEKANESVCAAADIINSHSRMGTTIVVAVQADENKVHIAHVGDSRAYLVKQGSIGALTKDHSIVYEMMQQGRLTPQECLDSPLRSVLTRCLGHERDVVIDKTETELDPGDWIMLCSDGLCGFLTDDQIAPVMQECLSAEEACSKLLLRTIEVGAPDNVTIVAVQYRAEASNCIDRAAETALRNG